MIVALYREDRSVPQLLNALDALDYPREKLDIILAVEADDVATRFAIRRFGAPHLRVIVAPDVGPRTKPKALNCALPFARGSVIAVFDAEDQPDPGQLRAAIEALRTGGSDVACAQASLCIHNVTDSLFTRMFAAEYAGQFDKVLPGLTEMALPLPLGGTSNHFRADALRAVGGWDAWNVTEDADLGLRLARFGYRAVTFASTTREEAPIRFMPWLKQRSRWMKGWMRLSQQQ
ncbi:MAG: glycosyl transferase, family 2, partial [Tardiphaga sp.]|nr:glycosyl transferase, family 2 [Tardiphaga sp.]